MAFTRIDWSFPLGALSSLLKPLRRGAQRAPAAARLLQPPALRPCAAALDFPALDFSPFPPRDASGAAAGRQQAPLPPAAAAARRQLPLRVIRREQGDGACRLVISGRMADVCAELDRLVLH